MKILKFVCVFLIKDGFNGFTTFALFIVLLNNFAWNHRATKIIYNYNFGDSIREDLN